MKISKLISIPVIGVCILFVILFLAVKENHVIFVKISGWLIVGFILWMILLSLVFLFKQIIPNKTKEHIKDKEYSESSNKQTGCIGRFWNIKFIPVHKKLCNPDGVKSKSNYTQDETNNTKYLFHFSLLAVFVVCILLYILFATDRTTQDIIGGLAIVFLMAIFFLTRDIKQIYFRLLRPFLSSLHISYPRIIKTAKTSIPKDQFSLCTKRIIPMITKMAIINSISGFISRLYHKMKDGSTKNEPNPFLLLPLFIILRCF